MAVKKKTDTKIEELRRMTLDAIANSERCERIHLEGKVSALRVTLHDRGEYDKVWLIVRTDGAAELWSRWPGTVDGAPECRYNVPADFSDVWSAAHGRTIGAEIDRIRDARR